MLLSLKRINKYYPLPVGMPHEKEGEKVMVLRDISLDIKGGESIAIAGPSGSGKSTLLHIIGTLIKPCSGKILFKGKDLSVLSDRKLAWIRNQELGFVFQMHYLLPQCTVMENVLIPTIPFRRQNKTNNMEQRARELLSRVGLARRIYSRPGQLSGGECQRVAVVRALINKPVLILADEPTGSLDQVNSQLLARLLVELNKEEGAALLVVTHALDLAQMMEKQFRLQNGTLVRLKAKI